LAILVRLLGFFSVDSDLKCLKIYFWSKKFFFFGWFRFPARWRHRLAPATAAPVGTHERERGDVERERVRKTEKILAKWKEPPFHKFISTLILCALAHCNSMHPR
jgi:hypothetical protein